MRDIICTYVNMSKTYTSLIVSHQARIRCLMHMYGIGILPEPATTRSFNETYAAQNLEEPLLSGFREEGGIVIGGGGAAPGQVASFKNAAVLRLVITRDTISASLVVSGTIDAAEDKPGYTYFVRPDEMGNRDVSYTETPFSDKSVDNRFYPEVGDDTYEFYLVRHGQADHNILKGMSKAFSNKDTSITQKGMQQAIRTGEILRDLIAETPEYGMPLYLFGSDLERTRQTMIQIIQTFPPLSEDSMDDGEKFIILPCAHELKYNTSSGKCDAGQGMMPTPNENISTCTREECGSAGWVNRSYNPVPKRFGHHGYHKPELKETNSGITDTPPRSRGLHRLFKPSTSEGQKQKYANDWSTYYDFYGDATRATRKWLPTCLTCAKKPAGNRCRDTDMIKEAIKSVKIEYERRNDESTHGSLRPSRATSFSSLSRQSFNDDDSDGEDDMTDRSSILSQRSTILSRHGGVVEGDDGDDSSQYSYYSAADDENDERMGGSVEQPGLQSNRTSSGFARQSGKRSRVRHHSTKKKKTRRRHSTKKKKTRRAKKNKKTRRKRRKQ